MERERQPLGVLEEIAAEVENHLLLDSRVDRDLPDVQGVANYGEREAGEDKYRELLVSAAREDLSGNGRKRLFHRQRCRS